MSSVKSNHAILPPGGGGLAAIARQLVEQGLPGGPPKRLYAVLGIVDCASVNVNGDTGEGVATVRFRRVAVLLQADLPAAEQLIRRAVEVGAGKPEVDLELEKEIQQAFEQMTDDGDAAAA
jgi:hypothetical protein